jgi:hypothetical protein
MRIPRDLLLTGMELSADRIAGSVTTQTLLKPIVEPSDGSCMLGFGYALALYYGVFDPGRKKSFRLFPKRALCPPIRASPN